jgi:hypothetical protein
MEDIKNYGYTLEIVPEKLITEELCMEAVKQNILALG